MNKNYGIFYNILSECDCLPEVFWENVGDDKDLVKDQIELAENKEEIEDIVNSYI